ncbi:glycine betaine/L-proline ABC transporter ATP-binding protein, partial [Enterococcus faecalis]
MRQEEVSMLLAVEKKRQLKGVVRAEKALEARKNGTSLVECVDPEIQTIDKDMLVNDIFPLIYDAQTPLAVTDNGKLLRVVIRGSVLEAL